MLAGALERYHLSVEALQGEGRISLLLPRRRIKRKGDWEGIKK